jgi:GxxExxY protein
VFGGFCGRPLISKIKYFDFGRESDSLRIFRGEGTKSLWPRMNTNEHESERADAAFEAVVGAAYEVGNVLGAGFLEKIYERALARECLLRGLSVRTQAPYPVSYKGEGVGDYVADLVVEDCLLVELKCADQISNEHVAQCLNYLKASGIRLGLLVNFRRSKIEWKRLIFG